MTTFTARKVGTGYEVINEQTGETITTLRTNRKAHVATEIEWLTTQYNQPARSYDELVAEMAAAMTCSAGEW
jgi:hypothetical protein